MSREKLMTKLSAVQFAMWEMRVYLDTHNGSEEAHRLYRKYTAEFNKLKAEYEEKYGPLTLGENNSDEWLKDPWPWDN